MGSEGSPVVTVHVTGFKKFQGVTENPTETIVSNLVLYMEKKGLPKGILLGNCTVLDTAGEGGVELLYKILQTSLSGPDNQFPSPGSIIWLHFGVNSGATRFAVENQAVNEATFRCPDEHGWKPHKVPIVPSDGGIAQTREGGKREVMLRVMNSLLKDQRAKNSPLQSSFKIGPLLASAPDDQFPNPTLAVKEVVVPPVASSSKVLPEEVAREKIALPVIAPDGLLCG